MTTVLTELAKQKSFGGWQLRCRHASMVNQCDMTFSIYLPPQMAQAYDTKTKTDTACPVVYWLSGLTCTDENFASKAGAQRIAAELGLVLVIPDTSPRGAGVANDDHYALGQGAGFYVNASQMPWRTHFQMYDYITQELPALIEQHFAVSSKQRSIMGHSMGGHGALVIALRESSRYCSVSAFAPIVSVTQTPWGVNALSHYLGTDKATWLAYDACHLLQTHTAPFKPPMLVDQGTADEFLAEHLHTHLLAEAAQKANWPLSLRMQTGYDHSYYFVSTFIEDHLRFHAQHLQT